MTTKNRARASAEHDLSDPLKAVQSSASGKVKVAVTDIDGVLRGKYLHKDKFRSAEPTAASASATSCSAGT